MLSVEEKSEIIEKYGRDDQDTGSPEVQIAILTNRINHLMGHFKDHKNDSNSKRGFFRMIGKRRSLLQYLKRKDKERYQWLIKELGIRK